MKTRIAVIALVLTILTAGYGKSTKLIASWHNPEYQGQHFKKVLVIGMSANPGRRSDFEDALSKSLGKPGIQVIPGNYLLLRPEGSKLNLDYVREQVKENKIDAVIVARLVSVKDSVTYVPPSVPMWGAYPAYHTFYGYYGAYYPLVYDPGYLIQDVKVRIETNLYAIVPPDGELVWTGTSDTFNPKDAQKVISGVVELVTQAMTKDGVF